MRVNRQGNNGEPSADPRDEFIRAMLRNFEAADADRDGVVTFSGTLMTKAGNYLVLRTDRARDLSLRLEGRQSISDNSNAWCNNASADILVPFKSGMLWTSKSLHKQAYTISDSKRIEWIWKCVLLIIRAATEHQKSVFSAPFYPVTVREVSFKSTP